MWPECKLSSSSRRPSRGVSDSPPRVDKPLTPEQDSGDIRKPANRRKRYLSLAAGRMWISPPPHRYRESCIPPAASMVLSKKLSVGQDLAQRPSVLNVKKVGQNIPKGSSFHVNTVRHDRIFPRRNQIFFVALGSRIKTLSYVSNARFIWRNAGVDARGLVRVVPGRS